jgi:D-alanyl-D-alanine carboxypeptidase
MSKWWVGLTLLLVATSPVAADDSLVAHIDAIGREAISRHAAPGVTIGVWRDGKVLIDRGYGVADLENAIPARAESVFSIASVTKNFTAAAILQLVDHGNVSLDDDIGKFIPDYPHRNKGVTLRRLLNHTAGIHNVTAIPAYWTQIGEPIEPTKLIALFRDAPLDFEPGSSYAYSNSGYILLGAVIEKAGAMPYPDYLRSHFFVPLGLAHTSYCGTEDLVAGRAHGYARDKDRWVNARHVDMSQGYAAGGICSTTGDLLRWQLALSHGQVLARNTYEEMIAPASGRSYGLGIGEGSNSGHRILFHGGGIQGFDAMIADYPDDGVAIVVLANAAGELTSDIEGRIARLVLDIPKPIAQPLTADARKSFAGRYHSNHGFDIAVVDHGETLFLESEGEPSVRLQYIGNGAFAIDDSPDLIEIHGDRLVLTHYGATRFEASRIR